ncbi:MAG TPA: xanthine dehydrogenase accessory protein XdhC [Noviherbaspirillum sp.]|uniref:xanthine dehydrogenase accessory protein XdhC n=1 Tax=Noviherbaspirillum sp. TaxID=1926288 RepID=UPI002B48F7F7|nr:xanthine dehydrogenase accessory protein XdhC [Noviherbaspirillum sp.]HJV85172.1 xanthine dehydrogenase accessory protein XdhC [Noviherbaspirillum sp.]
MNDWRTALTAAAAREEPAVLVTIASVQGSSPREPGAKMLVTASAQADTIGGGHLEMRACDIARDMLEAPPTSVAAIRRLERFSLGPSLGQCCGGVVFLAFERLLESDRAGFAPMDECWRNREDITRLVALDAILPPVLVDCSGSARFGSIPPMLPRLDHLDECHLIKDAEGGRWLVDPLLARRPLLVLFGAGHVGAAIVRALADLPCRVIWVDEREDMFPASVPSNVVIEVTDTPEAVVDEVPAGTSFLVMTHSHALDQRLAETILRRADAGWFGLIGSKTKRMQFEHRLLERGIARARLASMVCPIGIPGISGKTPAVIAASVCAQLLQMWEREEFARMQSMPSTQFPSHALSPSLAR